jgi:uncharacterized membrane protein YfcA
MISLAIFGMLTGFVAGFFGVGGGAVLIPMLLLSNYTMKESVSISVVQMIFSSFYGTFLNFKKYKSILKDGLLLGIGGFLGGILSGFVVTYVSDIFLKYLFLSIVVLAIYRLSKTSVKVVSKEQNHSKVLLVIIGTIIGTIAMSIGVGGAIMLTPILAGILFYELKYASSLGLFFVMFSSVAGFISLSLNAVMLYKEGVVVGIASLIGVYIGINIKNKTNLASYKKYLLILYIFIFVSVVYKIIK